MLEVKNLCKVYRPRRGVSVQALQDVSIRFPEKGMVFLLGRSGSGKSTLLNLLGGLDRYDSGEILLDDTSTKEFSQADFDSYRNACLGFVFQEYNVLPEFSVGVNIALALELQGKKATSEEIERILAEVDLTGYAARRPNELSGGQLQRVAIARALVKNPKIILADEPTGALDSATGRQVFETLKKLSETKLIIIVSHDREYSEQYADRIIELADGRIISDVTKTAVSNDAAKKILLRDGFCRVPGGYELTAEDQENINRYIAEHPEEQLRVRIDDNLTRGFSFEPTKEEEIETGKSFFERIRSKLPMRRAARIGIAGLRSKKVKLIFTVIMSVMAFTMFGLASTVADYDYVKTVSKAFRTEGVKYVYVSREAKTDRKDLAGRTQWDESNNQTDDREMDTLRNQPGVSVNPIYHLGNMTVYYESGAYDNDGSKINIMQEIIRELDISQVSQWLEVDGETLALYGCKMLVGELPDGSRNEILLNKVMYDMILNNALINGSKIPKMSDMIGTSLSMNNGEEMIITGIVDTGLDYMSYVNRLTELYGKLAESRRNNLPLLTMLKAGFVSLDFKYDIMSNPASCNLVGKGFVERQVMRYFSRAEHWIEFKISVQSGSVFMAPMLADIGFIDEIPHLDFTDPAPDKDNEITCYVSRNFAALNLGYLLSTNNRKYLGLDETIREFAKKQKEEFYEEGLSDPENPENSENPIDSENPENEDYPEDGESMVDPDADGPKYGIGDGTEFLPTYVATSTERRENLAYMESLSDEEFMALLERVTQEKHVTLRTQGKRYIDERGEFHEEDEEEITLNIIGMLPSKINGRETGFGHAIVGTPEKLQQIGTVNKPYCGAMVQLSSDRKDLDAFIRFTHEGVDDYRFQMKTKYNVEIDAADIVMTIGGAILIGVGVFFAIFAALLMTSFIANSIVYKKHEVGILRAIGSRGADVYRIFGSESCAVALICAACATILTAVLAGAANYYIIGLFHVSLMEFRIKQILLIFALAFGTALVASFLPVFLFARKRPIDAIRGR